MYSAANGSHLTTTNTSDPWLNRVSDRPGDILREFQHREFQHSVTASDGVRLAVREYLPDDGVAGQTLLFIHGACEHGGRYAEFAAAACEAGWRVLIPDLRGHGLSGGVRVHLRNFDQYLQDVDRISTHFSLEPTRTDLVGHSMGGLLVARYAQRFPGKVGSLVMLSPYLGLKIRVDRLTLVVGQILRLVWPTFRFSSRVRSADLSRDDTYLQERRQDTLISRSVTAGWFFAVQQALADVFAQASQLKLPVLVLQGDQDHVTDPKATESWIRLLPPQQLTFELLPGGLHELLQGQGNAENFQRILTWLRDHSDRPQI